MDPDALLKRLRELAGLILDHEADYTYDVVELAEGMKNLDQWLSSGGFPPLEWKEVR